MCTTLTLGRTIKYFGSHLSIVGAHICARKAGETHARAQRLVMTGCPKMDADGGCQPLLTIEENGKARTTLYVYVMHVCLYFVSEGVRNVLFGREGGREGGREEGPQSTVSPLSLSLP